MAAKSCRISKDEWDAIKRAGKSSTAIYLEHKIEIERAAKAREAKRQAGADVFSYGYVRVSTAAQDNGKRGKTICEPGMSPEVQTQTLTISYQAKQAMTEARGDVPLPPWAGVLYETASAFKGGQKSHIFARPIGRQLRTLLTPGSHLWFAAVDRSSRDVLQGSDFYEWCKKRKITLHFVREGLDTTTALGRWMIKQITLMAELESLNKSERQREVNAGRRRAGLYPAVGRNKKLFDEKGNWRPGVWEAIMEMGRLRQEGLTWIEISDEIERQQAEKEGREMYPRFTTYYVARSKDKGLTKPGRMFVPNDCEEYHRCWFLPAYRLALKELNGDDGLTPDERAEKLLTPPPAETIPQGFVPAAGASPSESDPGVAPF